MPHGREPDDEPTGPVVGWDAFARAVGKNRTTVWRHRKAAGCTMIAPWWESPAAARRWYGRLVQRRA